ncbi:acyl CoA:acetate/3-ketoacid CoA transferase [Methylobacterium nodulans]|uniref:Acetate CoA-transferase YdiF n=1 Tax=Methylobacterium nodulans (strain LMG 21967 / CNCM I-2342 / ORS 2060) TaxID=460265 RepID=B8IDW2_METNO|nr:acyl CoA:acetate/3-ketoacid CoA transferase [Methylobacterium nodulans]ACL55684.1 coenzyme A transferase [Methylobacterium nodulans ORS 2060]
MRNKLVSAEQAAALIPDGAVIAIASSSGLSCPDRVLRAIGERFATEGRPRDLTVLSPIAAGDMYGIKGVDHLARKGLISTIIAGSYPSGPSSLPSPAIWEMIGRNEVAAYNVPSGIMYDMARDAAAKRAGVLTKVGLETFVDPRLDGCKMNEAAATRGEIVHLVEFAGDAWLHFPNHYPQVAVIRGTTADEYGNVSMEHEGAVLGGVDLALAARNSGGIVICQVKRTTAVGSLPAQQVHIPSTLVDYVVVDPHQAQATETDYDPAISGELRRPAASFAAEPWSVDKLIARRAAMELTDGSAVNLGFGISALVPQILIEEGQSDAVTWVIEQGAVGGVPLTGFQFGCAANAQALFPSPQQFTYFQGGGFDCSLLSFLEVDAYGNVNVSRLPSRPYLTAGCGGFVDITANARKLVFSGYFTAGGLKVSAGDGVLRIEQEGKISKFVSEVGHVTFSGRSAVSRGQDVTYVTERCVLKLRKAGLTVVEVAPGVDLQRDVLARAGTPLEVAPDLKLMDERLFRPEPFGLALPARSAAGAALTERQAA